MGSPCAPLASLPPDHGLGDGPNHARRKNIPPLPSPLPPPSFVSFPNFSESEFGSSPRVLFTYQHVFFSDPKPPTSPPPLARKMVTFQDQTEPDTQPRSIMASMLVRWREKYRVGWVFLIKETIASMHRGSNDTSAAFPERNDATAFPQVISVPPLMPTGSWGQLYIRDHEVEDAVHHATSSEDAEKITIVHTVMVTVTSVLTDTELEMLTTTVFPSTCTTCHTTPMVGASTSTDTTITDLPGASSTPATDALMTGIMYCSFTGRHNVYTLCPRVHTDAPGMLTGAPAAVSSASRAGNPFSMVRVAVVSLWHSVLSMGSVLQTQSSQSQPQSQFSLSQSYSQSQSQHCGKCACDCAGTRQKLESAVNLVRLQQQLLESQRDVIRAHKKSLALALETLANLTAERKAGKAAGKWGLEQRI
ncbi:hypothetical protein F4808DRAFT_455913 [Astrocystis sublimbata]|nr:hypothetical protein F4808DRAFT_455913 [Astrocystis sublimbata]